MTFCDDRNVRKCIYRALHLRNGWTDHVKTCGRDHESIRLENSTSCRSTVARAQTHAPFTHLENSWLNMIKWGIIRLVRRNARITFEKQLWAEHFFLFQAPNDNTPILVHPSAGNSPFVVGYPISEFSTASTGVVYQWIKLRGKRQAKIARRPKIILKTRIKSSPEI